MTATAKSPATTARRLRPQRRPCRCHPRRAARGHLRQWRLQWTDRPGAGGLPQLVPPVRLLRRLAGSSQMGGGVTAGAEGP